MASCFTEKAGKEGRNGDDDDATSVMSFESSVVSSQAAGLMTRLCFAVQKFAGGV